MLQEGQVRGGLEMPIGFRDAVAMIDLARIITVQWCIQANSPI